MRLLRLKISTSTAENDPEGAVQPANSQFDRPPGRLGENAGVSFEDADITAESTRAFFERRRVAPAGQ